MLVLASAFASSLTGRDFGQHVADCAQARGGFEVTQNHGMHHGFAEWDGSASC
jgi:hypothetical protein